MIILDEIKDIVENYKPTHSKIRNSYDGDIISGEIVIDKSQPSRGICFTTYGNHVYVNLSVRADEPTFERMALRLKAEVEEPYNIQIPCNHSLDVGAALSELLNAKSKIAYMRNAERGIRVYLRNGKLKCVTDKNIFTNLFDILYNLSIPWDTFNTKG